MKKKIFKILVWSLATVVLLSVTLVIHIYIVTRPDTNKQSPLQLSRIDFKQKIDSVESMKIKTFVCGLEGVKGSYFNLKDGILVYSYSLDKQTSVNVFNKLIEHGHYQAERFVVNASTTQNACPMISDKKTFMSSVSTYISALFR